MATAAAARRRRWWSARCNCATSPCCPKRAGAASPIISRDAHRRAGGDDAAGLAGRDLSRTAPGDTDHAIQRQAPAPAGGARADHGGNRWRRWRTCWAPRRPPRWKTHWRIVLKNEFHDILPGSSIREVYEDAEAELGGAIAAGKAEQEAALDAIAEQPAEGGRRLGSLVVNPSLSVRRIGAGGRHRAAARHRGRGARRRAGRGPFGKRRRISRTPS